MFLLKTIFFRRS